MDTIHFPENLVSFPVPFEPSSSEATATPPAAPYQPSVYYFRSELYRSSDLDRAIVVALVITEELKLLKIWAGEQDVIPATNVAVAIESLRRAIRAAMSQGQAILLGLFLCHELEQLKAAVREAGLIPPKWIVLPEEAEAKGWGRPADEDKAVDF